VSSLSLFAYALITVFGEQPVSQKLGEEYSPKGGNFTVRFPGKPRESTQKSKSTIGEVDVFAATYATSDGNVYMVSYSDLPEKATRKENLDSLFEGVREGAKGDGKVRVCDKIEFGPMKLPGRELKLEKDKQWVRMYAIVRDNRLYQIAAVGSQSFAEGKEANSFIESFQLTSK
jgi:hypothetical protein